MSFRTKTANIMHKNNYVAIIYKVRNWKFRFRWRKIYWHILRIAKAHFRYTIWFMNSKKSIKRCALLFSTDQACTKSLSKAYKKMVYLSEFQILSALKLLFLWTRSCYWYKNVYVYRRQKFQNIIEVKHAIAWDSRYLFAKKYWTWNRIRYW